MTFDANGTFTRLRGADSWKGDAAAGTRIMSNLHDDNDNDLAKGLSDCLNRWGKGGALANLSMGNFKLTHVGEPEASTDAATKNYVDTVPGGWSSHKDISGTGIEGRLNFTGPTGVNGITWSNIDASWVARKANADGAHEPNRVVLNNTVNPGDTNVGDVFVIDEYDGALNFPASHDTRHNLIRDPNGNFRTPTAGIGGLWRSAANSLQALSNSVATTVAYGAATLENWFSTIYYGGNVQTTFNKKASGNTVQLIGNMGGVIRWLVELGNSAAEAGDNSGSDFTINGYNNAGGYAPGAVMVVTRKDGLVSFPKGTVSLNNTGHITTTGGFYGGQNFVSNTALAVLAATGSGQVALRPNGAASGTGQLVVGPTGDTTVNGEVIATGAGNGVTGGVGYKCRGGTSGATGANRVNHQWIGGASGMRLWVDAVDLGTISTSSDYRFKKDVRPLPSQWDRVKALRPISYTQRDWGDLCHADDIERWGFIAHELQESLIETAASGHMDEENVVQSIDMRTLVAALTTVIQAMQVRIEALEARP